MIPLIRSLTAPFLSLILLILASGLCNTFISIRLEMEGYNPEVIGSVSASLYAGIFVGSIWIDRWISKIGHIRSFVIFASLITLFTLIQSTWVDPYFWMVLRFLGGMCTAGIFIVIESWLLMQAPPALRGAILSIYLAVFYGALSLGQLLINASDPMTVQPFYLIAMLSALSILPLIITTIPQPKIEQGTRLKSSELFKISPFGLIGVVISGILLAAVYGLVPVYAKEIGLSVFEIGNLMALLIFGGLIFQWPLGRLADRGNRRHVLIGTSVLTTIVCCAIALSGHLSPILLFALIFLFGGFSFTIYPLSMAHACEKIEDHQLVSATGGFVLSYGIGAIAGPIIAPVAMNCLGSNGLFYFLALIASILVLVGCRKQYN
jgi:MFS family permease